MNTAKIITLSDISPVFAQIPKTYKHCGETISHNTYHRARFLGAIYYCVKCDGHLRPDLSTITDEVYLYRYPHERGKKYPNTPLRDWLNLNGNRKIGHNVNL